MLLLFAGALLSACGVDDSSSADDGGDRPVVDDEGGDREEDGREGEGRGFDGDFDDVIATTLDQPSATMDLDFSFESAQDGRDEVSIQGAYALDPEQAQLELEDSGGAFEIILDDGRLWADFEDPSIVDLLPEGAEWVTGDAEELGLEDGADGLAPPPVVYFLAGADNVEETGADELDGTEVEGYRFDLNFEAAVDAAPAEVREDVANLITTTGSGDLALEGEAFVDGEGRLRLLDVEGAFILGVPGADDEDLPFPMGEIGIESRLELTDFGDDVELDIPEEDETASVDDDPDLRDAVEAVFGG